MNAPDRFVIEGCAVATVDTAGTEHANGYLVVEGGRIHAVGPGPCPSGYGPARLIDGSGCLATPGLVNCHHHLYQWLTRGLAQQATLFEWLTELYPVWARLDAELEAAAARAALAALLTSGCSTTTDHHYVFPPGVPGLLEAEVEAAAEIGLRFHPCRGSMDLGRSKGGLPPDSIVQETDDVLAETEAAIRRFHDPEPGSMLRIAVAPCSPFSATERLMTESAELARRLGVRLHTHIAETKDEEAFCLERFGRRPLELLDHLGYLGPDVWLAHCVHLSERDIARVAETSTGVAWCPTSNLRLGSGIAPGPALLAAGAPVGLGVDGSASNDAGDLLAEARQAMLVSRVEAIEGGIGALEALRVATRGGAACLGRDDIGSLEVGKRADIALFDVDGLAFAGAEADPVAALVFCAPERVRDLFVDGRRVVEAGRLVTAYEEAIAGEGHRVARRILERAEG